MPKIKVVQSAFDEPRLTKLETLKARTGMTTSEIIRRLVDTAQLEPLQLSASVWEAKSEGIRQDSTLAFAG